MRGLARVLQKWLSQRFRFEIVSCGHSGVSSVPAQMDDNEDIERILSGLNTTGVH